MARYVKYTADDEEPDCIRCVHCCDSYEFCNKNCGAKYGWNEYCRMEIVEIEDKQGKEKWECESLSF